MKPRHFTLVGLFCLGAFAGQSGCSNDSDDVGVIEQVQISSSCSDYCDQAKACDDDIDVDACESDCSDALANCQADEQEQALEEVSRCSDQSCDEFATCTVGAGLQCTFGI